MLHEPAPLQLPQLHWLALVQDVPAGKGGYEHPLEGLQVPGELSHWFGLLQVTAAPPPQVPEPLQVSPVVHAFPSLQVVPAPSGEYEHAPVELSQVPLLA